MIKPYYETAEGSIYCGDALEILKSMDSCSVQCCITSPPYWGLRDYGTATWEGGDSECKHIASIGGHLKDSSASIRGGANKVSEAQKLLYKELCLKCGAKRIDNQLGLESTPEEYVAKMVEIFREVRRVLKDDGTVWLNLGDSYVSGKSRYSSVAQTIAGHSRNEPVNGNRPDLKGHSFLKDKDLCGIPWRVAFALQADGWYLRQDIIWHKPNPMPESVTDRCTKSHEYIFLLSKKAKYYYDADAIREPLTENSDMAYRRKLRCGRKYGTKRPYQDNQPLSYASTKADENATHKNKRSVWTVTTKPYKEAHFATFPIALIEPCILAGTDTGDIILDPFFGAGTTGMAAYKHDRKFVGIELNPEYVEIAAKRIETEASQLQLFR